MAEMYCANFLYNGTESSTYNLVFANIDTSRYTQLYGAFSSNYVFNRKSKSQLIVNDVYTDSPVTFDVEIVTEDGSTISSGNMRTIERWLFGTYSYKRLYIHDPSMEETIDGVVKKLYLNCRFINPEKLEYNGGVVGFKCTLECDSNMFWQEAINKSFTVGTQHIKTITVDSDIEGYTYPQVEINIDEDLQTTGSVSISNLTDDPNRVTEFYGVDPGDTIQMFSDINYTSHYGKMTSKNFIRLVNGENQIQISGLDAKSISFTYQNRRFF